MTLVGARHAFTNKQADEFSEKFKLDNLQYNKEADEKAWAAMQKLFKRVDLWFFNHGLDNADAIFMQVAHHVLDFYWGGVAHQQMDPERLRTGFLHFLEKFFRRASLVFPVGNRKSDSFQRVPYLVQWPQETERRLTRPRNRVMKFATPTEKNIVEQ